ncbi:MAG: GTP cyclohydrolase, FolE2/MptA family, partial [Solirubrobacterales bacterium]
MAITSAIETERNPDVQARRPQTEVSLTRVGVRGIEKVIRIDPADGGGAQLYFAELECYVDLNPRQAGAHMSRFEEVVNEAIDDAVARDSMKAEHLAAR